MDYRSMSDSEFADFIENLAGRLTGHELKCLDDDLADELAAKLVPFTVSFPAKIAESEASEAKTQSLNAERRSMRDGASDAVSTTAAQIKANKGDESDYDLCKLNFPKQASTVIPNDPSELNVIGTSNGVNTMKFKGNNKNGRVTYEIARREGDEGAWGMLDTTTKQSYEDKPVQPGRYYEYKVRAVAAKHKSNYSNTAVVYGTP